MTDRIKSCVDPLCPLDVWNAGIESNIELMNGVNYKSGGMAEIAMGQMNAFEALLAADDIPEHLKADLEDELQTMREGLQQSLAAPDALQEALFDLPRMKKACLEGTEIVETPTGCRRYCGSLLLNETDRPGFSTPIE